MPPVAVHFNGGVNLPDTETVLRTLADRVPRGVRRLPDGEPGERAGWIGYQVPRLLATPGLERVEAQAMKSPYGRGPARPPAHRHRRRRDRVARPRLRHRGTPVRTPPSGGCATRAWSRPASASRSIPHARRGRGIRSTRTAVTASSARTGEP